MPIFPTALAALCRFCCLVLTIAAAMACRGQSPRPFLKGPYLQAPGADTMTIMWESPADGPGVVHYGLRGRLDRHAWLEKPRLLTVVSNYSVTNIALGGKTNVTKLGVTNLVFLYEVTLRDLKPASSYSYLAEVPRGRSPARTFRTFGAHPDAVRFVAYGDTRTNPKTHAAIAARFKRHAPDFILHTGDLVSAGKRYDVWEKEFFVPLNDVIDEIPMLPAIGNHEEDGTNYLNYVHLPGRERWYSYDIGPVHVLALDYRSEKADQEQFQFARRDLLASRAPWKVVLLHYPVFNIGGHYTAWGHKAYLPLFHEARVDLVVAGHSHIYERFQPVASAGGTGAWPITCITTGGGGAPLTTSYTHPALAARAATNHYVLFEATPERLTGCALTTNDVVLDTFELRKDKGEPTPDYLARVYPEDALKLSFDAATNLVARLDGVPTSNAVANVMFTLRPLATTAQSMDLEIGLMPQSAVYYRMLGGPLHVRTPAAGESNTVVWARVQATGAKEVKGQAKSGDFSPALSFQGVLRSGAVETIAYGPSGRVSPAATEAARKMQMAKE